MRRHFLGNKLDNLDSICDLLRGLATHSDFDFGFIDSDTKIKLIYATWNRDKLLQNLLNNNFIMPEIGKYIPSVLEKVMILHKLFCYNHLLSIFTFLFILLWDPATKGQLISKCPFGVFKSPKKTSKFRCYFGRNEDLIKSFGLLLTFSSIL